MDFAALYHFMFETFAGMGILIAAGLLLSIIACIVMEWNTRRKFADRGNAEEEEDEWSFFDEDEDEDDK